MTEALLVRVRICANRVVACVRHSTLLLNIGPQDTCQFTSAPQINQLEGLAVAIPWGFESPLPHQPSLTRCNRERMIKAAWQTPPGRRAIQWRRRFWL
jgi:hypothetical protein